MTRRRKALVAMSGGVDSSVAAALLVEEGFDVTGVMLKLWKGDEANTASGCCSVGAADDARRVADALGIPFYVWNFADHFQDTVIRDFHAAYAAGTTPNPCVRCNHWVKFGTLLARADAVGADVLATGHYARVRRDRGRFNLRRGKDPAKDQSYVLWMLNQAHLSRCRFPVGELHKSETRRIAEELGLRTARKPDSQEICFVRGGDVRAYLSEKLPEASRPGPVLDAHGEVVGEHAGAARYTVGQRRGLGVSLGVPVYVTAVDAEANTVTVGDVDDLAVERITTKETSFVDGAPSPGTPVLVQHRAHGDVFPAMLNPTGSARAELHFDDPVRAVAPGQSAAFYSAEDPDELVGGGIISETLRAHALAG